MSHAIWLSICIVVTVLLPIGCAMSPQPSSSDALQSESVSYDHNSWQSIIPVSCLSFFDGCNNCRRSAAGEVAACTRKACVQYQEPRCLDEEK